MIQWGDNLSQLDTFLQQKEEEQETKSNALSSYKSTRYNRGDRTYTNVWDLIKIQKQQWFRCGSCN